jgi:chorismate mutase
MSLEELSRLRSQIDKIDCEIVRLLSDRYFLALKISKVKRELNLPVVDVKREFDVLEKVAEKAEEFKVDKQYVKCVYQAIIKCTTKAEEEKV